MIASSFQCSIDVTVFDLWLFLRDIRFSEVFVWNGLRFLSLTSNKSTRSCHVKINTSSSIINRNGRRFTYIIASCSILPLKWRYRSTTSRKVTPERQFPGVLAWEEIPKIQFSKNRFRGDKSLKKNSKIEILEFFSLEPFSPKVQISNGLFLTDQYECISLCSGSGFLIGSHGLFRTDFSFESGPGHCKTGFSVHPKGSTSRTSSCSEQSLRKIH